MFKAVACLPIAERTEAESEPRSPAEEDREAEEEGLAHRLPSSGLFVRIATLGRVAYPMPVRHTGGNRGFSSAGFRGEHQLRNGVGTALRL